MDRVKNSVPTLYLDQGNEYLWRVAHRFLEAAACLLQHGGQPILILEKDVNGVMLDSVNERGARARLQVDGEAAQFITDRARREGARLIDVLAAIWPIMRRPKIWAY